MSARPQRRTASRVCTERLWASIGVPELLGLELEQYKWRQNQVCFEASAFAALAAPLTPQRRPQSYVEVFMQLPAGVAPRRVVVALSPTALRVAVGDEPLFGGALFAAVKAEESLWLISDGVLEIRLLKRSRRGFYANGACNADTYWWSLFAGKVGRERIAGDFPPPAYYKSEARLGLIETDGNSMGHVVKAHTPPSAVGKHRHPRRAKAARGRAEAGAGADGGVKHTS